MTETKFLRILYKIKNKNKGNFCPYCKQIKKTRVNIYKKRIYFKGCSHYVSCLKNTPLYKTTIKIQNWIFFLVVFQSSHSLSSTTAGRILNVTARQGYNCIKKIRKLIKNKQLKRAQNFQIDELFLGSSKRWNHHQKVFNAEYNRINKGKFKKKRKETWEKKSVIYGIASSNGEYILINSGIKASGSKDLRKNPAIQEAWLSFWDYMIDKYIPPGQFVYHDGDTRINKLLDRKKLEHDEVSHSKNEYVKGSKGKIVTTNAVEGLFGRFQRSFKGTHTFAKKHLQLYLNDWAFKNSYKSNDLNEFLKMLFT